MQNRYNFAQDLRVSLRGFGARSAVGIRGIKIIVDGIPETLPDGRVQFYGITNIRDLRSLQHDTASWCVWIWSLGDFVRHCRMPNGMKRIQPIEPRPQLPLPPHELNPPLRQAPT